MPAFELPKHRPIGHLNPNHELVGACSFDKALDLSMFRRIEAVDCLMRELALALALAMMVLAMMVLAFFQRFRPWRLCVPEALASTNMLIL
jgi:hypothetical protein